MSIRQGRPEDYSKGPYLIVLDVAPCSLTFALLSPPPGTPLPYRCSSFALRPVTATFLVHRHSWTSLVSISETKLRNITTSAALIPSLCLLPARLPILQVAYYQGEILFQRIVTRSPLFERPSTIVDDSITTIVFAGHALGLLS